MGYACGVCGRKAHRKEAGWRERGRAARAERPAFLPGGSDGGQRGWYITTGDDRRRASLWAEEKLGRTGMGMGGELLGKENLVREGEGYTEKRLPEGSLFCKPSKVSCSG